MSSYLLRQLADRQRGESRPADKDESGDLVRGFKSSYANLGSAAKAAVGAATGAEDYLLQAQLDQQANERLAKPNDRLSQTDSLGDWAAFQTGNALGSLSQMVVGGGLGGLVVKGAAKEAGKRALLKSLAGGADEAAVLGAQAAAAGRVQMAGVGGAMAATTYPQLLGENALAIMGEKGALSREDAAVAAGTAVFQTALDVLPVMHTFRKLGLGDVARTGILNSTGARSKLGQIGRDLGAGMAMEGVTEAAQETLKLGALEWVNANKDHFTMKEFTEVMDAFAAGAVGGLVMGGAPAVKNAWQSDKPWLGSTEDNPVVQRFNAWKENKKKAAQAAADAGDMAGFEAHVEEIKAGKAEVEKLLALPAPRMITDSEGNTGRESEMLPTSAAAEVGGQPDQRKQELRWIQRALSQGVPDYARDRLLKRGNDLAATLAAEAAALPEVAPAPVATGKKGRKVKQPSAAEVADLTLSDADFADFASYEEVLASQDAREAVNDYEGMQPLGFGDNAPIAQSGQDFGFDALEEPLTPSPAPSPLQGRPSRGEGNKMFTPVSPLDEGGVKKPAMVFDGGSPIVEPDDVFIPPDFYLGRWVDYGGVQGRLTKDESGLYVGDVLVESGLSGARSAKDLGIKMVGQRAADIGDVRIQREQARQVKTDWRNNQIGFRGKNYTYASSNSDADGVTVSVTANDDSGRRVTFREPTVVATIESQKITYELEQSHEARRQWDIIKSNQTVYPETGRSGARPARDIGSTERNEGLGGQAVSTGGRESESNALKLVDAGYVHVSKKHKQYYAANDKGLKRKVSKDVAKLIGDIVTTPVMDDSHQDGGFFFDEGNEGMAAALPSIEPAGAVVPASAGAAAVSERGAVDQAVQAAGRGVQAATVAQGEAVQPAARDEGAGVDGGYLPAQQAQAAQQGQEAGAVGGVLAGGVPQDGQDVGVGVGGGLTNGLDGTGAMGAQVQPPVSGADVAASRGVDAVAREAEPDPVGRQKAAWKVAGASRDLASETAKANVRQFAQDRKAGTEKKVGHKDLQVGDEFWVEEANPRAVGGKSTRSGIITGIERGKVSYDSFYMGKYSSSPKPVAASRLAGGYIMRGDDVHTVTIGAAGNQEPLTPHPPLPQGARGGNSAEANPVVDVVDSVFESGKKVVVLAGDAASAAALAGDGVLVAKNHGALMRKPEGIKRIVFDGVAPAKVLGNKRMKLFMDAGVQFVFVSALPVGDVAAAFEGIC